MTRIVLAFLAVVLVAACPALGWREVDIRVVGADAGIRDAGGER